MATIRQRASGTWEVIIRRKGLLSKAHSATALTKAEAQAYARTIESMLDQGVVPPELLELGCGQPTTVDQWLRQYSVQVHITDSDNRILNALLPLAATWRGDRLTMQWAQAWVADMKQKDRVAPSTIRNKAGALARCLDWCVRNGWLGNNPLRHLPRRYSSYAPADGDKREDIERDRRLEPGEYERIIKVLENDRRIKDRAAWRLLFVLALETGMRLREMYTLTTDQVDVPKKTIFLDKTKNGDKRQVPLSSVALAALADWPVKEGYLFPFWGGRPEKLRHVTMRLSSKWRRIAQYAGCEDLHFHDLRHSAVCNFYENTTLSDLEIAKVTGHKSLKMLMRYANLRASSLADKLW